MHGGECASDRRSARGNYDPSMAQIPIACDLTASAGAARVGEWSAFLAAHQLERSRVPGGIELRLKASDAARDRLRRLIELETRCCAWINWQVEEADAIVVRATADSDDGAAALAEMFLPTRGSPSNS